MPAEIAAAAFVSSAAFLSTSAFAGWGFIPEQRHGLVESYGLYQDHQIHLLYGSTGRTQEDVGWSISVAGDDDSAYHPQIVFFGAINVAGHATSDLHINSEQFEGAEGFSFDFAGSEQDHFSLGIEHNSGHSGDGMPDPALFDLQPLYERLSFRGVHDFADRVRLGATLYYYLRTSPDLKSCSFDQFAEWYPWGASGARKLPRPYLAAGLEEKGVAGFDYVWTVNAQVGLALGDHMTAGQHGSFRWVLGYYGGADLRMKNFFYRNGRETFAYTGISVGI